MEAPFEYSRPVSGKHFVGRKQDCANLAALLADGVNVSLYEAPKSGKRSLVEQTLANMRAQGRQFTAVWLNLFTVRMLRDFLDRLSVALGHENVGDIRAVLDLPWQVASATGNQVIVILEEFQNLGFVEDPDLLFRTFELLLKDRKGDSRACYVMSGSKVNAMKEIFEHRKFFWWEVKHLELSRLDERDVTDHVIRGFMNSGKVIEKELLISVCERFDNNLWYINHFIAICDSLTKGYILPPTVNAAMAMLMSVHEPRFTAVMNDLTTFQVNLLRAVHDGHKHLSTSEVIREYGLNSSANVRRLKDALCKKEIISFNADDEPYFLDPLFKFWVGTRFFGKEEAPLRAF